MYTSEACLADDFSFVLSSKDGLFAHQFTASEFYYGEGKTDFVAVDDAGDVMAFELKLSRWRDALHQAYRNSSFAHYSYVVMPLAGAKKAARQPKEFVRRGVGLIAVDDGMMKLCIDARREEPLRPWLTSNVVSFISSKMESEA